MSEGPGPQAARAAEQLARLQAVTAKLGGALDVESVADVIFTAGLEALGTASALLALVEDGERLRLVRHVGLEPWEKEAWTRAMGGQPAAPTEDEALPPLPLAARTPLCEAVRNLDPVFLDEGAPWQGRYPPGVAEALRDHGQLAVASLPLSIPGPNGSRVAIGGLRLTFGSARRFEPEERAFMGSLADQCAQALHRARLFDEARAAVRAAAEATRTRDQFLAAISHELRAPTAAMLLWEKLLRDDPDNPETRRRALDAIHESLMAQSRMVDDLLDLARGIGGKLRVDHRPVAVEPVVRAAVERFLPAASARGVRVEVSGPYGPALVLGDEVRLGQVLSNLLSNAIKYSDPGGRLLVETRRCGEDIEVEVRDQGRGFRPDQQASLFEPFQPSDDAGGEHHGGLGLGLAIARQIARLHGGSLVGSSAGPGRGASFVVTLPSLPEAEVRPAASARGSGTVGPAALRGVRALVVDDDPYVREALTRVLRRAGATVDSVASAAAARALLGAGEAWPDVILCDVVMPQEDGPTFLRRVRDAERERNQRHAMPDPASGPTGAAPLVRAIKAIALTAHTAPEVREAALGAGFDEYLVKPIEPAALVAAVVAALERSTPPAAPDAREGDAPRIGQRTPAEPANT